MIDDDRDDDEGDAEATSGGERPRLLGNRRVLAAFGAGVLAAGGLIAGWAGAPAPVATVLFAIAILFGSFGFAREAAEELLEEREVGIELLMTAAIAGAAALGHWREGALVASLFSISEALEGYTVQRTRFAVRALMDLVPPVARLLRDDKEVEVPLADVRIGDRFVVRPGESIPTDGKILEGSSAIDESAVTGESVPAERGPGGAVFAGTINGNGALVCEATKTAADNTVAQIIHLVEEAHAQKGQTQLFVERFGRIYSPLVLVASILVALVPFLLFGGEVALVWARRAVALLVAAAPCALAVATPVTLIAAIGSAAKRGILIKGGTIVEALGRVRAVAMDKTGTLTLGRPDVVGIHAVSENEPDVLRLAASVERYSEHPLARGITRAAETRSIVFPAAGGFQAITAAGAEAVVEGRRIAILKPAAAVERGVELGGSAEAWRREAESAGRTVVVVSEGTRLLGLIALADTIRPEAREVVSALKAAGVEHVIMLTGDNEPTARAVAAQVRIDEVHAALLPAQKVEKVKELRARYGGVMMVGDGINDAPALAAASLGVAMGAAGSDAALAAADVALLGDDLSKIDDAIVLGRRSRRVIAQNIAASLAIVVVLVAATFFAGLSMFAAVVGHEGSEVLIILNGLRVGLGSVPVNARPRSQKV